MYDQNAIKIYTDGSAQPNPGKGGIGMVAVFPDEMDIMNVELSKGYKKSTNNRMELMAVISALEWLQREMQTKKFTRVIFITDSEYVYSNHENVQYWKKAGWCNEAGKPYENSDLWETFLRERQKTRIRFDMVWEKGKQNLILNRVDALAKAGTKCPTNIDFGLKPAKFTSSRTESKKAAQLFNPKGQTLLIRIFVKSEYERKKQKKFKITFDIYDEVTKLYSDKFFAYQVGECTVKRNNCYRASFNDNPLFPVIVETTHIEYLK